MEIHILQAGEARGPFSEQEVRDYLGQGLVAPSDLAIRDGSENWQPLNVLLSVPPPTDRSSEMILPDVPPPPLSSSNPHVLQTSSSSAPSGPAQRSESLPPRPNPTELIQALTATQRTRRKLSKIVIQPIHPLESSVPIRKKPKTGRTSLTLEPLRTTAPLPSTTALTSTTPMAATIAVLPRERRSAKTQLRTGQLSLGLLAEKPGSESAIVQTPVSLPPAAVVPAEPVTAAPAAAELLPQPVLATKGRLKRSASGEPSQMSRRQLYVLVGTGCVVVGVILLLLYLFFAQGAENSTSGVGSDAGPAPPGKSQSTAAVIPADPRTSADYSDRGFRSQQVGNLDAAISDYNRSLQLDSRNSLALYRRGLARQTEGNAADAAADFTSAINLNPKLADAFSNRAFIKQSHGDFDGAIADYNQALTINPKIPLAYYNVGLVDVQKGDLDEAIANFNHALDLDPNLALAYYNRGIVKNSEGNLDGAIADFSQAITLNPKFSHAYCDRGFARQVRGDYDGALGDYTQAVALDPNLTDAFYNRGLIRAQRGDLEGAIADNSRAIELAPQNGAAYSNRGLARFGKGDLAGARDDLAKFCELAPRDAAVDTAHIYLWLTGTELNPKSNADQDLSTALLDDWNSPPEDLTSKIAGFLLGHINESELIANAASPDPGREPQQYCKVWYFAGMKRLLNGDMNTAITYFQKSLATNQRDLCEYVFAEAQLKALGQNREISSNANPAAAQ